ncbi:MAG: hypothetical protein MUD01_23235 [Chloroflexaceae bacterium]|nr:hypothetical protein [Chloroflexaceae bacterium]
MARCFRRHHRRPALLRRREADRLGEAAAQGRVHRIVATGVGALRAQLVVAFRGARRAKVNGEGRRVEE